MGKTTITDIPLKGISEDDKFGLSAYEKGLETFLRSASTPVTVALQGEWGSGKTSLMMVLKDRLCGDNTDDEFFHIWINTWEYSLMRNPNEALLQILLKMIKEVNNLSDNKGKASQAFGKFVVGVTRTLVSNYASGAGETIDNIIKKNTDNSIAYLRKELQEHINTCISNTKKKGIIFFIDDLDRIDPPVVVEFLELLKNVFSLEHCIFILAIDYDVVVKGLIPKFGELNEKNEREFRSFFDKIVQVSFSMPVSQYSTIDYLDEELRNIGVIDSNISDVDFVKKLNKAEMLSVGTNPRSIKRFLNTLSLIKCIETEKKKVKSADKEQEKEDELGRKLHILLNLAIVGIQVAYPKVYQLLCIEPGFTSWNDKIASEMGIASLDDETKDRLSHFDGFDEEWEKVLFCLCLSDRYLRNNAINISQLLNMIREEIRKVHFEKRKGEGEIEAEIESEADFIRETIQEQLSQVSITGYIK